MVGSSLLEIQFSRGVLKGVEGVSFLTPHTNLEKATAYMCECLSSRIIHAWLDNSASIGDGLDKTNRVQSL